MWQLKNIKKISENSTKKMAEKPAEQQQPYYPSECPMSAEHQANQSTAPPAASQQPFYPSECPMSAESQANAPTQAVNPLNNMPPPNQRPSPDQPFELDTTRVSSSIPKFSPTGEHDKTWQYPSPQMERLNFSV